MDDEKAIIHAKMWGFYMKNNKFLIKGGYSVKVSGYGDNKLLWEVIEDPDVY